MSPNRISRPQSQSTKYTKKSGCASDTENQVDCLIEDIVRHTISDREFTRKILAARRDDFILPASENTDNNTPNYLTDLGTTWKPDPNPEDDLDSVFMELGIVSKIELMRKADLANKGHNKQDCKSNKYKKDYKVKSKKPIKRGLSNRFGDRFMHSQYGRPDWLMVPTHKNDRQRSKKGIKEKAGKNFPCYIETYMPPSLMKKPGDFCESLDYVCPEYLPTFMKKYYPGMMATSILSDQRRQTSNVVFGNHSRNIDNLIHEYNDKPSHYSNPARSKPANEVKFQSSCIEHSTAYFSDSPMGSEAATSSHHSDDSGDSTLSDKHSNKRADIPARYETTDQQSSDHDENLINIEDEIFLVNNINEDSYINGNQQISEDNGKGNNMFESMCNMFFNCKKAEPHFGNTLTNTRSKMPQLPKNTQRIPTNMLVEHPSISTAKQTDQSRKSQMTQSEFKQQTVQRHRTSNKSFAHTKLNLK